jgi:catechol 2,3-dioxygenase-like lactoylglutathione lyase family enzyme
VEFVWNAEWKEADMTSHIDSTTVAVADQDAALDFYVNAFGWEKALDYTVGPELRFLTVIPPGAATQLVLAHTSWAGPEIQPGGDTGISLVAPDFDAAYEFLYRRGVKLKEPVNVEKLGAKAAQFYDLDGNEFHLIGG